ncbi:hypothetical protein [Lewinella sp. W8]|uniref:hypothetical protein n=1 Tax=Lewinella sp. W8 TaxID=2528208 RepID=UPI001068C5FE|nr:hypothetical protein [Lewinella sp. W8]MTB52796.1 hypothetical protein [Lewinella sp. W8]
MNKSQSILVPSGFGSSAQGTEELFGRLRAGAWPFRKRTAAPLRRPNALLILLAFFLLGQGIQAQDTRPPLVMFAEGEVRFAKPDGKSERVFTGMYLSEQGSIVLKKNSRVELIYNDKFVELKEPGTVTFDKIFGTAPQRKSFIQRFSNFVGRGLDQSSSARSIEKAYMANQSNAQGNIRGFGDRGLLDVFPFGGMVSPTEITFSWPEESGKSSYQFRLVDSLSEQVVLEVKTSRPAITLNLEELLLQDGNLYYWEAGPAVQSPATSGPKRLSRRSQPTTDYDRYTFTYVARDHAEVLTDIRSDEFYVKYSRPEQQMLIEAMLLEDAGFLAAAYDAYQRGLEVAPKDIILNRNYAAFLGRWNLRTQAKEIVEMTSKLPRE